MVLKVLLFSIETTADGVTFLRKSSELCANYIASTLAINDDTLLVGDAMYSVALLRINNGFLESVSRNNKPLWPLSVEFDDNTSAIISNVSESPSVLNRVTYKLHSAMETFIYLVFCQAKTWNVQALIVSMK
jgi:hypothetical protein